MRLQVALDPARRPAQGIGERGLGSPTRWWTEAEGGGGREEFGRWTRGGRIGSSGATAHFVVRCVGNFHGA